MGFWIIILTAISAVTLGGGYYLSLDICRLKVFDSLRQKSRALAHIIAFAAVAACFCALLIFVSLINAAVILIHFVLFRLLASLIGAVAGKIRKAKINRGYLAVISAFFTVIYLAFAMLNAFTVRRTEYGFVTQKTGSSLRAVLISDTHIGAVFDGEGFAKHVRSVIDEKPDVVFICGDFVDDGTDAVQMRAACAALRPLAEKCRVVYVFGNHDKGYYSASRRGYSGDDLINELEQNGVTVLQDDIFDLGGGYCVIGRKDRSDRQRKDISELMRAADGAQYVIVLDHQPNDYENEASSGCDLVLSGHTHGGQLIPVNSVGEWIGANDSTYGHKRISNTDFIVTSGLADWELLFKTGCVSEYVVIDINR